MRSRTCLLLVLVGLMPILTVSSARYPVGKAGGRSLWVAMGNPAAIYCEEIMGYEYETITEPGGGQRGICIMPDGRKCPQWKFYSGECGANYSYCSKNGYRTETRSDGQDPFSPTYAVCLDSSGRVVGSMSRLSNLVEVSARGVQEGTELGIPKYSREQPLPAEAIPPSLPSSFDWRNYQGHNWLTRVRDQKRCGSCWAFAAVGVVEAHHNILWGDPDLDLDLSEQDLVSCSDAGDCDGGYPHAALAYIRDTGIVDESCFPYTASNATCNKCSDWQGRLVSIDGYDSFTPDPASIKAKVKEIGPIWVVMGVGADYGGYFDGNGIYRCTDDSGTNHAVVIVGWNDAGGYWIVRNSWGEGWPDDEWNDNGYFKVGYGECGIDSTWAGYAYASPPTVSALLDGTEGENGWYRSDVEVSLYASDAGSGVERIEYQIDSGEWQTYNSESTTFTISDQGWHIVRYKAQDNFGLSSSEESVEVNIDSVFPLGYLSVNGGADSTLSIWVHLDMEAFDATSGVAQMRLRNSIHPWSDWQPYTRYLLWALPSVTGQTYTVEVQFKDSAGNISPLWEFARKPVTFDMYPPRPTSTGYRIVKSAFGAGIRNASDTDKYRLHSTLAQLSVVGESSSSHYNLVSGYWGAAEFEMCYVYLPLVMRQR